MTQEYRIWKPEHDGHAPPYWRAGMGWTPYKWDELYGGIDPPWKGGSVIYVPPEALTAPNEDAAFDVAIWLEQGRANLDKLPKGVVLPEPKDWATELWAETFDIFDRPDEAELIRRGTLDERDKEVISLFRTRFEQMIAERNKRDAQD